MNSEFASESLTGTDSCWYSLSIRRGYALLRFLASRCGIAGDFACAHDSMRERILHEEGSHTCCRFNDPLDWLVDRIDCKRSGSTFSETYAWRYASSARNRHPRGFLRAAACAVGKGPSNLYGSRATAIWPPS